MTVIQAIIDCKKHDQERQYMNEELGKTGIQKLSIKTLMKEVGQAVEFL